MRVVWDRGALGGYEGFCCFAFGLCGLWVDVCGVKLVRVLVLPVIVLCAFLHEEVLVHKTGLLTGE